MSTSSAASRKRIRTRLRSGLERVDRRAARRRGPRHPARPRRPPGSISDPVPSTSSDTLEIRAEGMLSITNQPRSSRVAPAVDRPAPDMPVTTRYSLIGPPSQPASSPVGGSSGRQRRVEPLVDGGTDGCRQPRYAHQLVPRRISQCRQAAELLDQPVAPLRAQPGDPVEGPDGHPLAPQRAVVGDGEPVGLVPQPLQQVEGLGLAGQPDRLGGPGPVDLLELLARDAIGIRSVSPRDSSTCTPTSSWPRPPSSRSSWGG